MVLNAFKFSFNYNWLVLLIIERWNGILILLYFSSFPTVYCQICVINIDDEMLRCKVCQSPHPRGLPKVCLELDHFLEEQFPEEYGQRRDAIELKQIKVKPDTPSSCMHICLHLFYMTDILERIIWVKILQYVCISFTFPLRMC